jgi:hypothetical protein
MDEAQTPSNSKCCKPSSEPFRFYLRDPVCYLVVIQVAASNLDVLNYDWCKNSQISMPDLVLDAAVTSPTEHVAPTPTTQSSNSHHTRVCDI